MIIILVLHAAHSLSRWHHLNRTMTMQSVLEVRPQHGDLRGPYGDPGPAPDSVTPLGSYTGVSPNTAQSRPQNRLTISTAGRDESPFLKEVPWSPVSFSRQFFQEPTSKWIHPHTLEKNWSIRSTENPISSLQNNEQASPSQALYTSQALHLKS